MTRKISRETRRIVIVTLPPVDEFDLVGPAQVFGAASRLAGRRVYDVHIVTAGKDLRVDGEGGLLSFLAQGRLADVSPPYDSVLLVCGLANRKKRDRELSAWLRDAAPRARRVGAVCVSVFLLAQAGLLDGRRATLHWRFADEMARLYPKVRIESQPIWVQDGNIFTSAGISAGIDLALAWVQMDLGAALATEIAREFVLFLRRPGSQSQLSAPLAAQVSDVNAIQELLVWITANIARKLTLETLADRAGMAKRTFERRFAREVGITPTRFVLRARVEAAVRQLQATSKSLDQIARSCGFGSADVMRRAFRRARHAPPRRVRDSRGNPSPAH